MTMHRVCIHMFTCLYIAIVPRLKLGFFSYSFLVWLEHQLGKVSLTEGVHSRLALWQSTVLL